MEERGDVTERLQTQVTAIDIDGDYLPERAIDAVHWLAGELEKIPEPFREGARLRLIGMGEGDVRVRISYPRPEADGEMADSVEASRKLEGEVSRPTEAGDGG